MRVYEPAAIPLRVFFSPIVCRISVLGTEEGGRGRLSNPRRYAVLFYSVKVKGTDNVCSLISHLSISQRACITVNRCHTLEPPTQDEDWTPPITAGDDDVTIGAIGEDDAAAAADKEEEEEEKAPPKALPCVI